MNTSVIANNECPTLTKGGKNLTTDRESSERCVSELIELALQRLQLALQIDEHRRLWRRLDLDEKVRHHVEASKRQAHFAATAHIVYRTIYGRAIK